MSRFRVGSHSETMATPSTCTTVRPTRALRSRMAAFVRSWIGSTNTAVRRRRPWDSSPRSRDERGVPPMPSRGLVVERHRVGAVGTRISSRGSGQRTPRFPSVSRRSALPSWRTVKTSCTPCSCAENSKTVPSADQLGCAQTSMPRVSRWTLLDANSTQYKSRVPSRVETNAMWRPSRDHAGAVSAESEAASSVVRPLPRSRMKSRSRPCGFA